MELLQEDRGVAERGELVGLVIGDKYELLHYIGSGASGCVYSARHCVLEKRVALKILHRDMARSTALVDLFKREALAASRIDHPNSVRVLDFGKDASGLLYIVMEFVEGPDLFQVLSEEFPLEPARICDIMCKVLAALSSAHELGVVHRDIKPENILVLRGTNDEGNRTDLIKICDFGIAQLSPAAVPNQLSPRVDRECPPAIDIEALVGTPEFMSPEQARNEPLDARSDIYSVGVLLFDLLTGRLPFTADAPDVVALMQCSAEPPHPSWFKGVDPRFDPICLKAMSKDPNDRYQSAREMRAAIRGLTWTPEHAHEVATASVSSTGDGPSASPPPSLPVRRRAELRMPRVAFAFVLLLGWSAVAAAAYVWPGTGGEPLERAGVSLSPSTGAPAKGPAAVLAGYEGSAPLSMATVVSSPPLAMTDHGAAACLTTWDERRTTKRSAERTIRGRGRTAKSIAVTAAPLAEPVVDSAPAVGKVLAAETRQPPALVDAPTYEPAIHPEAENAPKDLALDAAPGSTLNDTLVSARPVAATAKPEPLEAVVRFHDVAVRGSLATSIVQRAMERARPRLSACYAQAARAAGHNAYGSMNVEVEFDERGRARWARAAGGALPGLDRCVNQVAANLIAAQAPDTGTVKAIWRVSFER